MSLDKLNDQHPWNVQSASSFVLIALPLPLFPSGSKVMLVRWMQILSVMHRSRIGHTGVILI